MAYVNLSHLSPEERLARKRAQRKLWHTNNKDKERIHARNRHDRLKIEVFAAYGNKCVCCGETDLHFLTIDHIKGKVPTRHKHPSGRRISGTAFLALLKLEDFPSDCRILCWNCNCSYGYYGFCPHNEHSLEDRRYSK